MRRGMSRVRSALGRRGSWSRGKRPTLGQSVGTEGKHLRLSENTAGNLWRSEWNENHTDNPCCGPMHSGRGCKSAGKHSGWELERRDWKAIAEQGLLLTAGRWPEGNGGRGTPWRMPLEESWAAVEAGHYCWAMYRVGAITVASLSPHASTGSWPTKTPERAALWVPAAPSNREGPVREALWTPAARGKKKMITVPHLLCRGQPASLRTSRRNCTHSRALGYPGVERLSKNKNLPTRCMSCRLNPHVN